MDQRPLSPTDSLLDELDRVEGGEYDDVQDRVPPPSPDYSARTVPIIPAPGSVQWFRTAAARADLQKLKEAATGAFIVYYKEDDLCVSVWNGDSVCTMLIERA